MKPISPYILVQHEPPELIRGAHGASIQGAHLDFESVPSIESRIWFCDPLEGWTIVPLLEPWIAVPQTKTSNVTVASGVLAGVLVRFDLLNPKGLLLVGV